MQRSRLQVGHFCCSEGTVVKVNVLDRAHEATVCRVAGDGADVVKDRSAVDSAESDSATVLPKL